MRYERLVEDSLRWEDVPKAVVRVVRVKCIKYRDPMGRRCRRHGSNLHEQAA